MQANLLSKYRDARLPRYTSYPTAPHFSPSVGPEVFAAWLGELPTDEPVSLYLHIPFCRSMCWYCGCHTTITSKHRPIADYLRLLHAEIRMIAERSNHPAVNNVHFGGGTPTILRPKEFSELVAVLRDSFNFTADAELAVEIDPRTLTETMAMALGDAGVRRASLGVQTFDPVVQKAINRVQSEDETAAAVFNLKRHGVERFNVDLIYGLPYQSVESCVETANIVARMHPARVAVFGYAHIPSFKKHQRVIDESTLPDSAARDRQALATAETLTAAGYRQIGLDHFARPEDDLVTAQASGRLRRNFQGYTTDACETLIGLGASAISKTANGYAQNEVSMTGYARAIGSGLIATAKGCRLTHDDRVRADIIERLMCNFEADVGAICDAQSYDAGLLLEHNAALDALVGDGVLTVADRVVKVRRDHRFLVRAAAAAFDAYLADSNRTFSKAS